MTASPNFRCDGTLLFYPSTPPRPSPLSQGLKLVTEQRFRPSNGIREQNKGRPPKRAPFRDDSGLKVELSSELQNASIAVASHLAKRCRRADSRADAVDVGVISCVERLRTKLER
jgi:hypothetical protein